MVKRETIPVSEVMQHLNDFVQLLTEEQQAELRKNIEVQSYAKNQDIYVEGDLPQHLLCLKANGGHPVVLAVHGNHRRLVDYNSLTCNMNQGVGGSKVNTDIARK